jgi:hypothetical protein
MDYPGLPATGCRQTLLKLLVIHVPILHGLAWSLVQIKSRATGYRPKVRRNGKIDP